MVTENGGDGDKRHALWLSIVLMACSNDTVQWLEIEKWATPRPSRRARKTSPVDVLFPIDGHWDLYFGGIVAEGCG